MESKEYLIGKMSEVLGVSTDTLRFYEKKGILNPKKKQNRYRYYTEDDIKNFMWILYNRKLNFSLNEISDWKGLDSDHFEERFRGDVFRKIEEEQDILRHHSRVLKRLSRTLKDMDAVGLHLNQYSLKDFPDAYIVKKSPDYIAFLEGWYRAASCIPGFDMAYFYTHYHLNGKHILPGETDLLLYTENVPSADTSYPFWDCPRTEPRPCVYTIVKTESGELSDNIFYEMKAWARKKGLKTENRACSNLVMFRDGGFSSFYYNEIYIPLTKDTAGETH